MDRKIIIPDDTLEGFKCLSLALQMVQDSDQQDGFSSFILGERSYKIQPVVGKIDLDSFTYAPKERTKIKKEKHIKFTRCL